MLETESIEEMLPGPVLPTAPALIDQIDVKR